MCVKPPFSPVSPPARYYRNAHGALLVYDISSKESFEGAKGWLTELRKFGKADVVILLVGNKLDLGGCATHGTMSRSLEHTRAHTCTHAHDHCTAPIPPHPTCRGLFGRQSHELPVLPTP